MSSENLRNALDKVDIGRFDQIIPARRAQISRSAAEMPLAGDKYNTNRTAAALHPASQAMTVADVKDLPGAKVFRLKSDSPAPFAAGQ